MPACRYFMALRRTVLDPRATGANPACGTVLKLTRDSFRLGSCAPAAPKHWCAANHRGYSRLITSHIHLVHIYLITCECHPGNLFAGLEQRDGVQTIEFITYSRDYVVQLPGEDSITAVGTCRDRQGTRWMETWGKQGRFWNGLPRALPGPCWVGNGGHGTTDGRRSTTE